MNMPWHIKLEMTVLFYIAWETVRTMGSGHTIGGSAWVNHPLRWDVSCPDSDWIFLKMTPSGQRRSCSKFLTIGSNAQQRASINEPVSPGILCFIEDTSSCHFRQRCYKWWLIKISDRWWWYAFISLWFQAIKQSGVTQSISSQSLTVAMFLFFVFFAWWKQSTIY